MKKYLFFILLVSCATLFTTTPKKWYYQLQGYNDNLFNNIINSFIVIDAFNEYGRPFSNFKIKQLAKKNRVFSYLSIGEAENYRPYFKKLDKSLIMQENKNWDGNFTVKFWDHNWQRIIDKYLYQIIDQGFEGVYLDIIDVFHRFKDEKHYAELMLKFIQHISKITKEKNTNFSIILQNGVDIIDYIDKPKMLLDSIDGISIEAYLFNYKDNNKAVKLIDKSDPMIKLIKQYKKANKLVLSVEYNLNSQQTKNYFKLAKYLGVIPLVTDYGLKGTFFTTP